MADIFLELPVQAEPLICEVTNGKAHVDSHIFLELLAEIRRNFPDFAERSVIHPGGGALTAAALISQGIPAPVWYFGSVGNDAWGSMIEEYLIGLHIQCDLQICSETTGAMMYCRYRERGEEQGWRIIGSPGAAGMYRCSNNELFQHSDVYLEGFLSDETGVFTFPRGIVSESKFSGQRIFIDLGSPSAAYRAASLVLSAGSSSAEFLILGTEQEAEQFALHLGRDLWRNTAAVVKRGARGAVYRKDDVSIEIPAFCTHPVLTEVDTVGAGDAFAAGFIAELYCNDQDIRQALKRGSMKASEHISRIQKRWSQMFMNA